MFDQYAARHPELAEELVRRSHAELPEDFAASADAYVAKLQADGPKVASRKASQMAIEAFAPLLPELVGGSADLAGSNLTLWSGSKSVATDDADANYIYFGVREFAMTAISNGLALHGGFIPYDATFLVFSDYARNAVRMSALMGAHAIHVYTHDSIGLGEDGPTHQPVEHLDRKSPRLSFPSTRGGGAKSGATYDADANYIYFGVRECAMTAISNGLALHGGFIPYDATFLVFSDYARNAVRMSALMGAHAIHVYTHDSIGLGEDGPTHQPVEHLASLRHIPNNDVWRPCDAVESAVCWRAAIERRDGPSCLVFSRQGLAHQPRGDAQVADIARGGYVLKDSSGAPELVLIATGSEGDLAMQAATQLGDKVRVVSMPSTDVFDRQPAQYRESVLPDACRRRVAIEAGITDFWRKSIGRDGPVAGNSTEE